MGQLHKMVMDDPSALIVPVFLLLLTLAGGFVVRVVVVGALQRRAQAANSQLGVLLSGMLRGSLMLWSAILGIHIATQNSQIPQRYLRYLPPTLEVLWILLLTLALSRLASDAARYYGSRVNGDMRPVTSLTQRLAQVTVVILGMVWMLRVVFNIDLTPVLATLGVGGLAVALALQDTLSNLFAGFYVSISGLVHIGDYVRLSTGEEGYVADITWRSTTMRGTTNNLVVIPNNKLGQTIFTNYFLPDRRVSVSISVSVAMEEDIDRVQAILHDEVTACQGAIAGLLAEPAPQVLFISGAADPASIFEVDFSVTEFGEQYRVQSELRKRLRKRLRAEGIAAPSAVALALEKIAEGRRAK